MGNPIHSRSWKCPLCKKVIEGQLDKVFVANVKQEIATFDEIFDAEVSQHLQESHPNGK